MSVQRQSVPPPMDSDVEATAELPVLDVAVHESTLSDERSGSTDTWHMPVLPSQAGAVAGSSATAAQAAIPDDRSAQLEIHLRSLSESLREVEERLTRKGERLVELERELTSARAERVAVDERAASLVSAVEERAASLDAELAAVRAALTAEQARAANLQTSAEKFQATVRAHEMREYELAKQLVTREQEVTALRADLQEIDARAAHYLESLQTLEGRRTIFEGQLLGLDGEVEARDAQLIKLREELAAHSARARDLTADLSQREQRIEMLERAAASHSEFFTQRLQELEHITRERDAIAAKAVALEASLASATAALAEKEAALKSSADSRTDLDKRLTASQQRAEELERELAAARGEIAERVAAMLRVETERDQQLNRGATAETRIRDLEQNADEYRESIRQLQEELRSSLNHGTELEGDLCAAEDAINRLEAELRAKNAKLEDLTKTHEEWRGTVENARASLVERDSEIHRLEAEAANSAVLLGNIQQSIKRLDPAADSGTHEIAPEGAVRLLIRTDGDTEVVHVLGRKTTVGRTPDNDLQIDAKFISRNHAVILAGPNHTIIEDLNSTNGVAVNNKRVSRHTLRDGDVVSIGKTSFRFAVRPTAERRN